MKILQVSAHYPPDFVSGGALVPNRLAQAAADAGHESFVFTGNLNDLRPLEEKDTVDGSVQVHWVGNSSFLGWDSLENFNNPAVAELFAKYLQEVRPDVVHFHSIQTLGAQILDIAHASGAATVLTMHDFWWICARQFLVDVQMRPCPLVVSCGECQCSRTSSWLAERTQWLRNRLDNIDLILAPSNTFARVLVANGVPSDKLRVNENGVDGADGRVHQREKLSGPVRFMYAGGEAEMKGYCVLRDSLQKAQVTLGTSLDLYNASNEGFPEWVIEKPPYSRKDVQEVFQSHDVLILPSVMRESHSIVTREALAAGMAVICTDTLGPEEAVADGVNGMIVEAGSSESLSKAIELMSDRDLCSQLVGHGSVSPIRTNDEQIDQVFDLYGELTTNAETVVHDPKQAIAGLLNSVTFVIGLQGAPARYRAHLPAEALATVGIHVSVVHYRDPRLPSLVVNSDAVVFYRVPATSQVLELITSIRNADRRILIIGDIDDLIFNPEIEPLLDNLDKLSTDERQLWVRGIHRYRTTLEHCDFFVGSTELISHEATRLIGIPSHTFLNGVGRLLAIESERALLVPRRPGPLRIGYFSGTDTHDADWATIETSVGSIMKEFPDVELWLGGLVEPTAELGQFSDRIVRVPFCPWQELPQHLRSIDINLVPLTKSIFNEAKSSIKWLEAALVCTPTIAAASGPYCASIDDGRTGFLAESPDDWTEKLRLLIGDSRLRERIGAAAKREVLVTLGPSVQGARYRDILVEAWTHLAVNGHRGEVHFEDVSDDEPFSDLDCPVEPYEITGATDQRLKSWLLVNGAKLFDSLKTEGIRGALNRALRKLKSELRHRSGSKL